MCVAVSGITKSDGTIFMPESSQWIHSHSAIANLHGIPDGVFGDKYARWELTPKDGDYRSNQSAWVFKLDEQRVPSWWAEDAPALIDKARRAVERYMKAVPDNLVPSFNGIVGNDSTLTGGYGSTLTGGDGSTLTGGDRSTLGWRVWDGTRYRTHIRYTGEDGIEVNVKYRYANGNIEKVRT